MLRIKKLSEDISYDDELILDIFDAKD